MARQHKKGLCPKCGKKGLGIVYVAAGRGAGRPPRPYRQCCYCSEVTFTADLPAPRNAQG